MIQQIEEHITKVDAFTASTLDDVEKFRIEYLGKKGVLNDLFAAFKNVPIDQKKAFGQKLNELKQADYNADQLPKGKNSVKGLGKVSGTPENFVKMEDGTLVPLGPGLSKDVPGGSLIYNEYIVYDTAQVRLRYLAKINFKFNK
ncbi:MAG: hypothetical protein ACPIAB_02670 [Flavobacteriaceae bacterium]